MEVLAGEMEFEKEERARADGMVLDESALSSLKGLARDVGLGGEGFWND